MGKQWKQWWTSEKLLCQQSSSYLVKPMVFPVIRYGCESWTIKKAERQRIDAFGLWCCIRLLRVPWTARRSNQSILKEISPEYSLEGLMLKLKLQYFEHLMGRIGSLEKTLMLGKLKVGGEGDGRGWDGWMTSLTNWTWIWANSRSWWWTGRPGVLQSMGLQGVGHNWGRELNWQLAAFVLVGYFREITIKSPESRHIAFIEPRAELCEVWSLPANQCL